MGAACSPDSAEEHTTNGARTNRGNTDKELVDDESVTGSNVDSPPPPLSETQSEIGFWASLFGGGKQKEPESLLEYDIWKKLAIYSAQIPRKMKRKVWKSLFKKPEDKDMEEKKLITKVLKTYLVLYLTKEYKKKGEPVPEDVMEYIPDACKKPAAFMVEFIKKDPSEIRLTFARVYDILYARTQTTSVSKKKRAKFAKKAKMVTENYDELTEAELSSDFNRKDFLITAYLQYLIYSYHLTLPPPKEPTPEPSPEPVPTEEELEAERQRQAEEVAKTRGKRSRSIWDMLSGEPEEEEEEVVEEVMEEEVVEEEEPENDGIDRSTWTKEAIEWELKLDKVAKMVKRAGPDFRLKIWTKFDRRGHGYMDMSKELSRLLYAFLAFYVKRKKGVPPKFSAVLPLLLSVCVDVADLVNEVDEDYENEYILKQQFVDDIHVYLKKVAYKRLGKEETPPPPEPTEMEQEAGDKEQADGDDAGAAVDGDGDDNVVENDNGDGDQNENGDPMENTEAPQEEEPEANGGSVIEEEEVVPDPTPEPEMTPDLEATPEPEMTPEKTMEKTPEKTEETELREPSRTASRMSASASRKSNKSKSGSRK